MRERVALAGGTLAVETSPDDGTTVRAVFPVPADPGR
jgi:signal transduction histidine kinase